MATQKFSLVFVCVIIFSSSLFAGTWQLLDYSGSTGTSLGGIEGQNIVGSMVDTSGVTHGVIYNGTSWSTLDYPGTQVTKLTGISGNTIVGTYEFDDSGVLRSRGFIYDGQNWSNINVPGSPVMDDLFVGDIDGDNVVGFYEDSPSGHGFIYDGTNWTTITYNDRDLFMLSGISGSTIVGNYIPKYETTSHGLVYNSGTWTTLDFPGYATYIRDVDGTNMVGFYKIGQDYHGFLYDGTNWTTLDFPGSSYTMITGIDGQTLIGNCFVDSKVQGFIYTIPEPATMLLITLGGLLLRKIK